MAEHCTSGREYDGGFLVRNARQPADRIAQHLQAPALTAGNATEHISLPKAGKMAAVNVNNSPKTGNI